MYRLAVNNETLHMALAPLHGTPEELQYFTAALMRSNTEPNLYATTPAAAADPATISAAAADKGGDWALMVHPHVLAQIVVDLCERTGTPLPDNTYVYIDNDWKLLSFVQPSMPSPLPAPPRVAVPPIVAATTQVSAPAATTFADLASPVPTPTPPVLSRVDVPDAVVLKTPTSALENLLHDVDYTSTAAAVERPAVTTPAVTAEPAAAGTQYALPLPVMAAVKGKSPFDTDPSGKVPSTPPDRATRDIVAMLPALFALPAADVVGKGKGAAQRLRVYMAALQVVDTALAGVPDPTCPVGYLRHQIAHLRYNASQTPAGPTMLAFEQYVFTPGSE